MNINSSKRKISRHESKECSQQSIVSAMDRFVMAVNNMEDTVMIPSRLMDLTVDSDITKDNRVVVPQSVLNNTDLHSFYQILNHVKTELIWGLGDGRRPEPLPQDTDSLYVQVPRSRSASPNPLRKVSSSTGGDSDSELVSSYESDSEAELLSNCDSEEDPSVRLAGNFRRHLSGLFHTLHQLSEVSDYLTTRYQQEVGSTS